MRNLASQVADSLHKLCLTIMMIEFLNWKRIPCQVLLIFILQGALRAKFKLQKWLLEEKTRDISGIQTLPASSKTSTSQDIV